MRNRKRSVLKGEEANMEERLEDKTSVKRNWTTEAVRGENSEKIHSVKTVKTREGKSEKNNNKLSECYRKKKIIP